jgi:hypothetical protein
MLNDHREKLKAQAEFFRQLFLDGEIDIAYAKEMIMPYINLLCIEREKLSKAYGRYLPTVTFEKFIKNT